MQPDEILQIMKAHFAGQQPPEVLEHFAEQSPRALLKESLDVVDFVVYLEEQLDREIDLNKVGAALQSHNFGELAAEVSRLLGSA
jgi:acyl carrier protein